MEGKEGSGNGWEERGKRWGEEGEGKGEISTPQSFLKVGAYGWREDRTE